MTAFSLSRALLLAALATAGVVSGNPVDLGSSSVTCDTVKCSSGYACKVIDGKAQCITVGEQCGNTVCAAGTTCCNASCGTCVKPGMACTAHICTTPPVETPCGPATCKAGLECCNESCGICVEPGKGCTKQFCVPAGEQCGKNVCAAGLVCCNSSCGICAPPDGACTMQYCGSLD